jgi:hypothetical protein
MLQFEAELLLEMVKMTCHPSYSIRHPLSNIQIGANVKPVQSAAAGRRNAD